MDPKHTGNHVSRGDKMSYRKINEKAVNNSNSFSSSSSIDVVNEIHMFQFQTGHSFSLQIHDNIHRVKNLTVLCIEALFK
jgi:hypothetical protein